MKMYLLSKVIIPPKNKKKDKYKRIHLSHLQSNLNLYIYRLLEP